MINLFTSYYQCGDPVRQKEIDFCINHNITNRSIDKLYVFIDDGSEIETRSDKVSIIRVNRRPTYADWLEQSKNLNLSGVSILCNSDIHFDENITEFRRCFDSPRAFIALSRYEVLSESLALHPNPHWSQDVWAVHMRDLGDKSLLATLDFPMGVPRCDNKIAYQFAIYGWTVLNPCEFIKSYHVHETGFRTYDKKLDDRLLGGVAYVHASDTINSASKLDFDIWVKDSKHISKVQINKSLERWIAEAATTNKSIETNLNPDVADLQASFLNTTSEKKQSSFLDFLNNGELIHQFGFRFRVYRLGGKLMYIDNLSPQNRVIEDLGDLNQPPTELSECNFMNWFPPVLDISPIEVKKRPSDANDCQFWQYPCSTEEQALSNHLTILPGQNLNLDTKTIDTYLALPWATYIDKKKIPDRVLPILKSKIAGLSKFAASLGFTLNVHTVCQQIHWRRFIAHFNDLGVTDLHISHLETGIDKANLGVLFRLHSWPLIGVNVETPERAKGLEFGKSIDKKSYLASFIGAHMPHYRSDVRVRLFNAAKKFDRDDVLVDLGNEWHFNKIVYQEQVLDKKISQSDSKTDEDRTINYNRVISDSIFSLCPEGAGPNTLRLWESMAVGSIPVVLADEWIAPKIEGLEFEDCVVIIKGDDVETVFDYIDNITLEDRKILQKNCIKAYAKYREFKAF